MSSYCFIKPYDNEYTRLKKLYQMVYEGLLNKWCIVSNVMTVASNSLFYLIANKNTHIRTSYYENNNDSPITNYGCNMSYKIETKLMFNVTENFHHIV
uniref:ORF115 n=1 Tax=Cnaphalocrocis medinalis granulovirus TaxID=1750712 RepID=A0A109WQU1_9BBAC|nr:ORF115 [Cnaphalocrocis medinalis granulovirus]